MIARDRRGRPLLLALLGAAALLATASGCTSRVVAPLRYGPVPLAPDESARATPPRPGPPLPREPLDWRVSTLENGLRVVVLSRPALPIVTVRIVVDRGGADAGASPEALGLLTQVMNGGTADRPADAVAESYALLGANHQITLGYDACELRAKVHASSMDAAVQLLAASAIRPRFVADDFQRTRARWLQLTHGGPGAQGANQRALIFGGREHPYGYTRPPQGYREGLRLEDIAALHAVLFDPARVTLVVVGDVRPDDVVRSARRWLGAWAPQAMPLRRAPPVPPRARPDRVVAVANRAIEGTHATIGVLGPPAADADMAALELILHALTGLTSPIGVEVREHQGASYGIDGTLTRGRLATSLAFGGHLENAKAAGALRAMLAAVRQVRAHGLAQDVLERSRAGLLGRWRQRTSTTDGLSGIVVESISLDASIETMEAWPARLAAVTAADVQRVAARYFADESLRVLVIGTGIPFEALGQLGLGPVEVRDAFADRGW